MSDYKFIDRPITSFHLEITSKCAMACPRCPRTIYKGQYKMEDLPVELIEKRFTAEVLDPVKFVLFCGDHGDPIYHSDFHGVIRHFKKHKKKLTINTNGSRRKKEWWEKTVDILEKRDDLKFSIDGLADSNHLYRVNSKWSDIVDAIDACRGNVRMIWKFIVFKHNQHQIAEAERLAEKWGFDQFTIVRSHLFGKDWLKEGETEDPLMPDPEWLDPKYFGEARTEEKKYHPVDKLYHYLRSFSSFSHVKAAAKKVSELVPGSEKVVKDSVKMIKEDHEKNRFQDLKIYPKCKFGEVHYVNAHGHYLPCCWAGNYDLFKDSVLDQNKEYYDLNKYSFEEIQRSEGLKRLEKTWHPIEGSPRVCQLHCSSKKPPKQWEHSYDVEDRQI